MYPSFILCIHTPYRVTPYNVILLHNLLFVIRSASIVLGGLLGAELAPRTLVVVGRVEVPVRPSSVILLQSVLDVKHHEFLGVSPGLFDVGKLVDWGLFLALRGLLLLGRLNHGRDVVVLGDHLDFFALARQEVVHEGSHGEGPRNEESGQSEVDAHCEQS